MLFLKSLSLLAMAVLSTAQSAKNSGGETPWTFWKEAQNVKIYYRESPDGGVKEVKMITDFETTPSAIVALVEDFDGYKTWVYKSTQSRLVKRYNSFEVDYYNYIDFPWPLTDRDVAVHSKISQDPKTKALTSISTCNPTAVPKVKDAVRISLFNSKWVFTQAGAGKLHSEYQFRSHPGGNIPSWMVNLALDEGPLNTIAGMRRALKQVKYKNAQIEGIVD
ncbi:MAG: hypothetical protein RI894_1653 [Bacteroidota bacterium]|jgi:hypothetical protein